MTKFTFDQVTFSDGATGVIEASVKGNNKSKLTHCGYFTDDYVQGLGSYEEFIVTQPEDLRAFCLGHFPTGRASA